MAPIHDYFYRFPREMIHVSGRCRVRVYERNNGRHTVLLTELNSNSGESITSACDRIATDLVEAKGLQPATTRWIQHEPPYQGRPQEFDELKFAWGHDNTASEPEWHHLTDEQVETMTGEDLSVLSRRSGEMASETQKEREDE